MNDIYAAKQVGNVGYFVPSIEVLINILKSEHIYPSLKAVTNPKTKKKEHSVSFTRDLLIQPKRNSTKWKFGVIIDGDNLSNRYSIEPFSYFGNAMMKKNTFRVKQIVRYDDDVCILRLVGWATQKISRPLYDKIKELMLKTSDDYKEKKNFVELGRSSRPFKGHTRVEAFAFNVPSGGISLDASVLDEEMMAQLSKSDTFNEREERVWLPDNRMLKISGSIVGVVVPKDYGVSDPIERDLYQELMDILYSVCENDPKIIEY